MIDGRTARVVSATSVGYISTDRLAYRQKGRDRGIDEKDLVLFGGALDVAFFGGVFILIVTLRLCTPVE